MIFRIRDTGDVYVAFPVSLPPLSNFDRNGNMTLVRAISKPCQRNSDQEEYAEANCPAYEITKGTTHYLRAANVDDIKSIADIINSNKNCSARELPNGQYPRETHVTQLKLAIGAASQPWLVDGLHNPPSKEEFDQDVAHFRRVGRDEGIDEIFKREDLNLLAFSTDSLVFNYASAAGICPPLNVGKKVWTEISQAILSRRCQWAC